MASLPRFLHAAVPGFEIVEMKEWLAQGRIEIFLERKADAAPPSCFRCGTELISARGKHRMKIEGMPILGLRVFFLFWRQKKHCPCCGKARSEHIAFLAKETPHLTLDYAWWIGRLCEIAAITRVAELTDLDPMTTWRLDLARMKLMLSHYTIPEVKRISVDEVYARKKPKSPTESRDERFFTVISDLDTHRVIWVSDSRNKKALDEFFIKIGEDACKKIEVAAMDQHDEYAASVREHCPQATIVWDRFHLMQNFEEAVNDTRKQLHNEQPSGTEMQRLTRGKYRFLFLKKASRRTDEEKTHLEDVMKENQEFLKLELIKERMLSFFHEPDEQAAWKTFQEIGDWIFQAGFKPLMDWHNKFEKAGVP